MQTAELSDQGNFNRTTARNLNQALITEMSDTFFTPVSFTPPQEKFNKSVIIMALVSVNSMYSKVKAISTLKNMLNE